ncbi:unnamed protein product [Durusdinium trenchii]|uniref:C3H1-type domain-containing protein n=2 Tax=Durusdinium trenchii TaxID=1381693 RepID=A0ABP0LCY1_9DINO
MGMHRARFRGANVPGSVTLLAVLCSICICGPSQDQAFRLGPAGARRALCAVDRPRRSQRAPRTEGWAQREMCRFVGLGLALGVAGSGYTRCFAAAKKGVEAALGAETLQELMSSGEVLRPLIVAMGTRGDAEPGFRLAAALRDRGHLPLVVSLDAYKAQAERLGLDFRSCGIDKVPLSEEYLTGKTRADQVFADRGWYGDAWTMVGERIFAAAQEHDCDLIVATSMGNTHCLDVAEKLKLLCFALKFCPDIDGQVPTASFPPSGYPSLGPLNTFQHVVENLRTVAAVFRGGFIPKVIEFRTKLGLPSQEIPGGMEVPLYSDFRQKLQENQPCLYAFSPTLVNRPAEYQPWHFITGFFGSEMTKEEPLAGPLEDFLAKTPPVCIAFGSMTLARSAPFQQRALLAARRAAQPVLVVDPDEEREGLDPEDSEIFRMKSVPYSSLLPKCRLVVHHGGAGTLQDSILAKTPQLIAPVLSWSDQPFWAFQLENQKLCVTIGEGGEAPTDEDWDAAFEKMCFSLTELSDDRRPGRRNDRGFGPSAKDMDLDFDFEEGIDAKDLSRAASLRADGFTSSEGALNRGSRTVCIHFLRGLCMKGDKCDYLHQFDPNRMPECTTFLKFGKCLDPVCMFKHVAASERQECPRYRLGFCKFGPLCRCTHERLPRHNMPDVLPDWFLMPLLKNGHLVPRAEDVKISAFEFRRDDPPPRRRAEPEPIEPAEEEVKISSNVRPVPLGTFQDAKRGKVHLPTSTPVAVGKALASSSSSLLAAMTEGVDGDERSESPRERRRPRPRDGPPEWRTRPPYPGGFFQPMFGPPAPYGYHPAYGYPPGEEARLPPGTWAGARPNFGEPPSHWQGASFREESEDARSRSGRRRRRRR